MVEFTVAYDATVEAFSRALEMREGEPLGHTHQVTEIAVLLARAMDVSPSEQIHIRRGALLHDVGTIMVPEKILLKTGPLTIRERKIMEQHPGYSHEMLSPIN